VVIQWYPGHIAKAEKELQTQLKRVDVVIEVRDARIPRASAHPQIPQWVEGKLHLVVVNRMDAIDLHLRQKWQAYYQQQGQEIFFANARSGEGVRPILAMTKTSATAVNQRRQSRGMLQRPARAVVVGFPNVGKSALINRLLNRKVCESANRPGVTRQLRWIRISDVVELLDTPGVIPPLLQNQETAVKLAICDDIGTASYDPVLVAARAIELWQEVGLNLADRYGLDYVNTGNDRGMVYLAELAEKLHQGDKLKTALKLLHDYRSGKLGTIGLEVPPS